LSEQYRTCSQSRAHFFRQLNGRPHRAHTLSGCPSTPRARGPFDSRAGMVPQRRPQAPGFRPAG
jgi:hypothetical protein